MENRNIEGRKLTFKNILFLSIFGLILVLLKYNFTKGNLCHETCSNINSELDLIRCLDACAINGEDFREPVAFKKVISYIIIIVLLAFLLYQFLHNFIIRRDRSNIFLQFIQRIKEFKDSLINQYKYEKYGYKKLDDSD